MNSINIIFFVAGLFVSVIIILFIFRAGIINNNTKFLFLQSIFYAYVFSKINSNISKIIKICLSFLNSSTEFTSILDYIFLNKDSDAEAGFTANLLNLLPGTFGVLMKKRYLIVQSLDVSYFSLSEMYNISIEIGKIDDDSLV